MLPYVHMSLNKEVTLYLKKRSTAWRALLDAEVKLSDIKKEYTLEGKVDLLEKEGDSIVVIDFKSEQKPEVSKNNLQLNQYMKQLEVYAYLVEKKYCKPVSKLCLYYTKGESADATIVFSKDDQSIQETIKSFDRTAEHIMNKEFSEVAKDLSVCANCQMKYYCKKY